MGERGKANERVCESKRATQLVLKCLTLGTKISNIAQMRCESAVSAEASSDIQQIYPAKIIPEQHI